MVVAALLGLPVSYFGFVLEQVVLLAYRLPGKLRTRRGEDGNAFVSQTAFFHTLVFPGI